MNNPAEGFYKPATMAPKPARTLTAIAITGATPIPATTTAPCGPAILIAALLVLLVEVLVVLVVPVALLVVPEAEPVAFVVPETDPVFDAVLPEPVAVVVAGTDEPL